MANPYAITFPLHHIIERNRATVIEAPVYQDGALVAPTAGTATVKDGGGTTISTGSVTITGDVATYTVPAADTDDESLSDDWVVEWSLTVAGSTVVAANVAHLARQKLYAPVSSADLRRAFRSLDSTDTASVTTVSDLSPYIEEAWYEIEDRLINKGRRAELVMSPSSLRRPLKHLALAGLFDDLALRSPEWSEHGPRQRQLYEAAWGELSFRYDADQDGLPDPDRVALAPLWLS